MMLIVMLPPPTTKSALTTSESLARIGLVIKEISRNKQRDTEKKKLLFVDLKSETDISILFTSICIDGLILSKVTR